MIARHRSTTRMALASAPMSLLQVRGSAVSTVKCRPRTGSNDLRMKPWTSKPAGRTPLGARSRRSIRRLTIGTGETTSTVKTEALLSRPAAAASRLRLSR